MKHLKRGDVEFVHLNFLAFRSTTPEMPHFHQHNDIEVFILLTPPTTVCIGGVVTILPALRLGAFWAIQPHISLDPPPDTTFLGLYIPLMQFFSWNLPADFVRTVLSGRLLLDPDTANGEADAELLARWADDFEKGDVEAIRIAELEAHARLWRLARALGAKAKKGDGKTTTSAADLGRIELMTRFVAEQYRAAISVEDIARAAGVHPKYAMRLFRRTCGITLLQYLTQHRVRHAQRMLSTENADMYEIAQSVGFGSTSRFREVFKHVCGVSPRAYRASQKR